MTTGYTPYKRAWNAANKARIRTYNRIWMRKDRLMAGKVKKPRIARTGHAWSAEQRHNLSLHNRVVRWAKVYQPDILGLLHARKT